MKNDWNKIRGSLFTLMIMLLVTMVIGCSKKPVDLENDTLLEINKSQVITLDDDYIKVVVTIEDVILNDGKVDHLVLDKSIQDGNVTLNNIEGRLLEVKGGGSNSIYVNGSSFDNVEVKREEGAIRLALDEISKISTLTVLEGSKDVIISGNIDNLDVNASSITIENTNTTLNRGTINGSNNVFILDINSSIEELYVNGDNNEIVINGYVERLIVSGKSNITINGNVKEIIFLDGSDESTITITSDGSVDEVTTDVLINANGDGIINNFVLKENGDVNGELAPNLDDQAQQPVIIQYTVTFIDYNDKVIKIEKVKADGSALAPVNPSREGYTFIGWDKGFSSINYNLTIRALYRINDTHIEETDLTVYNAALAAVSETDYTVNSWITYQAVVTANLVTIANTQAEVDTATETIVAAQAALIEVADLTDYNETLSAVVQADYTEHSWTAYQVVVSANVVTDQNTQAEVDIATGAINTAQAYLVFAGQATLDSFKLVAADFSETQYTIVTWAYLTTALALPETNNTEVVTKTMAILTAIGSLIRVADLTDYNATLAAVVQADYTEASWTAYQLVVSVNVVTDQKTQKEVDSATATITAAQADLVTIVDANLQAAKDAESLLISADYVDYSAVTTALALPETSDEEKITKTNALYDAIAALEAVPSTYEVTLGTITRVEGDEDSTITINSSPAEVGATVYLMVDPKVGMQLKEGTLKAVYNDGEEKVLSIYGSSPTYSITMPAYTVVITAEFENNNAGLLSVASETITPTSGTGVSEVDPLSETIFVDSTVENITRDDIIVSSGATFVMYSSNTFSSEITEKALSSGAYNWVYILVNSESSRTYYTIGVYRP